ncbi:ribonuclease P protein component [Vreelandella venusta]|uniref:Ribonuclease P protein component n=1 Tax=Vreelandella venusta TaxID=44935 RepID=A0AAP9ZM43_9GAMM|nr:ribonuclease P protein component [Halomonas venusta]MBR9924788.1 ribonuclease P protein component [Gammaproteobacteria bacterium]AZM97873.1 ribonuclease P protein component [Halomonas venusta]MDW0360912.1 ribonuclease P protein component [Halomonas venusta]MDX1354641.1 ribonuclease P protein component [Halomonas venusta]MDX1712343.1 ribonuclease P protein component [Halomonas venusta]
MPHQGFPRCLRLLNAGDFSHVFEQADLKVHGKGMMALARLSTRGHPRIGLVVSKKNVKLAVDRNRFKRLVRESVRLRQDHLPSVDIVILAKRGVQDIDNETLNRQLNGMWKRLQRDAQAVSVSLPPNGVTRDA